jgi:hypothetical protein
MGKVLISVRKANVVHPFRRTRFLGGDLGRRYHFCRRYDWLRLLGLLRVKLLILGWTKRPDQSKLNLPTKEGGPESPRFNTKNSLTKRRKKRIKIRTINNNHHNNNNNHHNNNNNNNNNNRDTHNNNRDTPNNNRDTPNNNKDTHNNNRDTHNNNRDTHNNNRDTHNNNRDTPNNNRDTPNNNRDTPNNNRDTPNNRVSEEVHLFNLGFQSNYPQYQDNQLWDWA